MLIGSNKLDSNNHYVTSGQNLYIGNWYRTVFNPPEPHPFNGTIREIAIHDNVLSMDTVSYNYVKIKTMNSQYF
jgi:hypothetical protein